MSGYLLSIIGVVLLTGILSAVLPEGKTLKLIKGTAKLCCLAVIVAPLTGFFKKGKPGEKINFPFFSAQTVIETDGAFIDYCSTKRIENAESGLEKSLEEKFSVATRITLRWEYRASAENGGEEGFLSVYGGSEIKITKVIVEGAEGELDGEVKEKMKNYIAEEYGCEVEFA